MSKDLYRKLVDLYAAGELTPELDQELEKEAVGDPDLRHDMQTMRGAVDQLRSIPEPEFTEESYQRILMKIYTRGVEIQTTAPAPVHLQYHLPMQG